jgi:hypothetical protein
MSKIVLGRRGFDASSENVSAQESGVSDDEIVALGNQMGKGYFHTLKTLNLASFAFPFFFCQGWCVTRCIVVACCVLVGWPL